MANHKSALKRIRANEAKRLRNRYQLKTARTFEKRLRTLHSKTEAQDLLNKVASMLDRLAKKNVVHKNYSSNHKSKLARLVNKM
jgi:small subunit ribosomal protein S20